MKRRISGFLSGALGLLIVGLVLAACGNNQDVNGAGYSGSYQGALTGPAQTDTRVPTASSLPTTSAATVVPHTSAVQANPPATDNLPPDTSFRLYNPSPDFKQSFEDQINKSYKPSGNTQPVQFQFNYYAATDYRDRVIAYYEGIATKNGYSRGGGDDVGTFKLGSIVVSSQGAAFGRKTAAGQYDTYEVRVFGPLNSDAATALAKGDPNLHPGDLLVITAHGVVAIS